MSLRRSPEAPPSDLGLLQREINVLFERLAAVERPERTGAGHWSPSVDVFESRGRVIIVVEVPGMGPESLKVQGRDHQIVVSGERKERPPALGNAEFLCMERGHGRFSRTIPLDMAVDVGRAEARLSGGLLTIILPHLKERRGRHVEIPVQRGEA